MPSIDEIRAEYRSTLDTAIAALEEAETRERMRLAASVALEAKRAHEANVKIAKLRAKVADYTERLSATGVKP